MIYNGLSQWPGSDALTSWNPKGAPSTVNYPMGSSSSIAKITKFIIFGRPIGLAAGRAYLCFQVKDGCTWDLYAKESGLAKYQFTQETIDVLHRFYFYKLPFDVSSFLDVTKSPFCFS